jgi:hypothetical protein
VYEVQAAGWPLPISEYALVSGSDRDGVIAGYYELWGGLRTNNLVDVPCLVADLAVFIAVVGFTGWAVEWSLRRRDRLPMGTQKGGVLTDVSRKPRRFQFHLSTAIVLMFVAGGLLWPNTIMRAAPVLQSSTWVFEGTTHTVVGRQVRGWPFVSYEEVRFGNFSGNVGCSFQIYRLLNLGVGLAIVAATAALLEWLIRRRERRQ